ncbi:unnamed protein product [Cylicostephanus goldi]|uniref:CUB domain-containing protein n=1 Tax=Cylicostephanus goldi TaxID=71465 RepID=A0A3P6S7N5_CYLGO|nr:unnamed protein product [Cylicostephanus goldi]
MACLGYEKGESGKFSTPNYPSPYRGNSNCRWVIEAPINNRIQVNILFAFLQNRSFVVESSTFVHFQLTFDYFETEEFVDIVTVLDGGPAENSTTGDLSQMIFSNSPKYYML